MMRAAVVLMALAIAAPVSAQSVEIAPFLGYTTASKIDDVVSSADGLQVNGGFTWGTSTTWFKSEHLGFGALFSQQLTAVGIEAGGIEQNVFDMTVIDLLATTTYQLGEDGARWRPFVFGGAGLAIMSARDIDAQAKFAWTAGGGIKWLPREEYGALFQLRYRDAALGGASAGPCDPFGFCQGSLPQFEFSGGFVFRF